jgi:hypothetical protein
MPVLFREMIFCECGRPAMHNSPACRTCYEDGLRRQWREDFRLAEALAAPVPTRTIRPPHRLLFAPPLTEEDAQRIRASLSQTETIG